MSYTIIDVIESFIEIEAKAIHIYDMIAFNSGELTKLNTASKVLIKEEKRHIEYYQEMKKSLSEEPQIEISLDIYNKISTFIIEFRKIMKDISAKTIDELLDYALVLENVNVGLLKQIQGALVGKNYEKNKKCYDVFTELINQEQKHVINLSMFIKTPQN